MALTKFRVTHIKPAESALLLLPANSAQCQVMKGRIASPGGGRVQEDSQVPVHFAANRKEKTHAEQPPRRGAAHNIPKEELHQEGRRHTGMTPEMCRARVRDPGHRKLL